MAIRAYCRLSPGERKSGRGHNADALGPEAQRKAISAWSHAQKIPIASWHQDIDVSGGDEIPDRPALLDALEALQPGDVLLAAKGDRFARDTLIAAMLERLVERKKATIATADGVGAGTGPEAQLMRSLVAAFAQYERALIRARTKAALGVKRQRGERVGQIPYGSRLGADGVKLLTDPTEHAVIAEMISLRSRGYSYSAIAAHLDAAEITPRGARWHPGSIYRILERHSTDTRA